MDRDRTGCWISPSPRGLTALAHGFVIARKQSNHADEQSRTENERCLRVDEDRDYRGRDHNSDQAFDEASIADHALTCGSCWAKWYGTLATIRPGWNRSFALSRSAVWL